MISASKVKFVKSLGIQKFRKHHQQFIVEGPKMVDELLRSDFCPLEIFAVESWHSDQKELLQKHGDAIVAVTDKEINRLSGLKSANKVLATVKIPERKTFQQIFNNPVIILDGISDPGNLGTIIRIADWFGIHNIICSNDSVELYNPKVIQASMGSLFRVKVYYEELNRVFTKYGNNIPVFGTTLDGRNIYGTEIPSPVMIVIGSESHGIRPTVQKFLTHKITIPSFGSATESLNAAVATGIVCSELMRNKIN